MNRHRCPVAATNKEAHRNFMRMLAEFRQEVALAGPSTTLVLKAQRELGQWIREHIVRTDTGLRSCATAASGAAART